MKKMILSLATLFMGLVLFAGCGSKSEKALKIVKEGTLGEVDSKTVGAAAVEALKNPEFTYSEKDGESFVLLKGELNVDNIAKMIIHLPMMEDVLSEYDSEEEALEDCIAELGIEESALEFDFKVDLKNKSFVIDRLGLDGNFLDTTSGEEFNILKQMLLAILYGDGEKFMSLLSL